MKKIIFISSLVLFGVIGLVFYSCESDTYDEISDSSKNPTYTKNIRPIIATNCVSCHSNGSQIPNLENYNEVKDATEKGNLICRIDDQSCGAVMPQGGRMPQTNIDLIKLWKNQGFVN